ncbi:copper amine oxidase N-terminal domain-containing protein [Paenibacillus andongensis]|uniref:copper amine oxidase N-terminal domain-containing protein n=1 Tax=Paenibacillus andongensis TaxID=2975482 RepID=UPI0021BAF1CA|nr:copper amine oxidase N-terminal domain-containing protein [Paenibacillus andongensis]
MKKTIVSIVGISMIFSAAAGVYAGANLQEIKAYLNNDIKVKVNGNVVQLLDAQGNVVTPITYDGSTYLPARAIASSLNVAVDYDAESNSVLFGEKVEGIPVNADQTFYQAIKDPDLTKYKSKDYGEVIKDTKSSGSNFTLEPNGKYQKLYLQVAAIGSDVELKIQDKDSKLLKQDTVTVNDGLKTIEVNIAGLGDVTVIYSYKSDGKSGIFVPLTTSYYK